MPRFVTITLYSDEQSALVLRVDRALLPEREDVYDAGFVSLDNAYEPPVLVENPEDTDDDPTELMFPRKEGE